MDATRVLAVRHGETDWNAELRIQGQLDIALNARGRDQAARLAEALLAEDVAAVYSSDLRRAFDTAQAYAARAGLAVTPERGLRERGFGRFEGLTFTDVERDWPDDAQRWRRREPDFAVGGGETLADFAARCVATAGRIAARHPAQTVVLVAHGGVLDVWYRAAARIDLRAPRTWQLGNASINRLLYSDGAFTLVGWDDRQHLEG